jgi:hypothetical protein
MIAARVGDRARVAECVANVRRFAPALVGEVEAL